MRTITRWTSSVVILLSTVFGCGDTDNRLVELSERSMARQAEQNKQMAVQSKEVAKATRQLVEADSQSRQEMIKAQANLEGELHKERASLDRQHESLQEQRQQLAVEQRRDPIVAEALVYTAALLACLLPLLLCLFIVKAVVRDTTGGELEGLLIQELTEPKLLAGANPLALPSTPRVPAIPHQTTE